jgi:hypothetical protein
MDYGFITDFVMPPLVCPRCKHTNPEVAVFCYFDGAELRPSRGGAGRAFGRLPREFAFPSGRRCPTFDDFVKGCQDEWPAARDLLRKGTFRQFFASIGRLDLAKAAEEAMAQGDADIGLTSFLNSLPVSRDQGPRLDLHPRRLVLGNLLAGETREVQLTVSNQGQGMLQGTLSVAEGGEWLRVASGTGNGQCDLKTAREQQVTLTVDTRGLAADQTYGAKLKVVTNGGIVEVPAGMNLLAHPFPRAPFQGLRTPREMAEKMRAQPKAAVPLLESGEVARWFGSNGWNYPIRGAPAKGVAGVQQFFEGMGLSKPPVVRVSQTEVRVACNYPDTGRGQVVLQTSAKKWVYAQVESDAPWLRVTTPTVAGPQQAPVAFAVDPRQVPGGRFAEGTLQITANSGQALTVQVRAEVRGAPSPLGGRFLQPVLAVALTLLLIRLGLAPLVDLYARGAAVASAMVLTNQGMTSGGTSDAPVGAWLQLPWARIFSGSQASGGGPEPTLGKNAMREFRDHFVGRFVRIVALWTWWLGALVGLMALWRRGGTFADLPWGLIAGAVAGVAASATLACMVLLGDLVPSVVWSLPEGGLAGGVGGLLLWIMLALFCWSLLGAALGLVLGLLGPLGQAILAPVQNGLAGFCRLCGLRGAASYFAPP